MKDMNSVGPDRILVEIWKWLGEDGLKRLIELFNVILRTIRMPHDWESGQSTRFRRAKEIFNIVMIIVM